MRTGTIAVLAATFGLANACLLEREIEADIEFARTGKRSEVHEPPSLHVRQSTSTFPIGTGDRFSSGSKVPRGLGVEDRNLASILNVNEVTSAMKGLKTGFPDEVQLFEPPYKTYEGRSFTGAVIGSNPRVFIMSGIHARERGGPDNVIYFLADLLAARKAGTGVKYGGKSYTAAQVKTALSAGIVVIPLTNPDGVAYDQRTSSCWRKNRNPKSASSSNGRDVGVDLNRNYDFVWDFQKYFHPSTSPASDDPASETFYGTGPASEPETKAVVWTLNQYKNLSWFMDLHSYGPSILYAWGDDDAQTITPAENFVNSSFDGKRGLIGTDPKNAQYKEYFTSSDLQIEEDVTDAMIQSMLTSGGASYTNYPAVGLYATSGASNDYAMGRYYGGKEACGSSRMFGLTMEFGTASRSFGSCPFYPNSNEYHRNVRQVGAGFFEMMLQAAGKAGDPLYSRC
ncbi:hypothetical protein NLU13_0005 [Sarocladium strictum]|uniref:Peptidase M14 domain-containing protein n=1 Tax=Sarocladium strictum TaxID=5046 RepID=A0AA39GNK4_SARSR|nr:hypothetical protein NLU13_0005 [Sarocladium strictum]